MTNVNNKSNMTVEEFVERYPEYITKPKIKDTYEGLRYVCQCKHGHIFDYRNRELYPSENKHYAPCQGKCPVCGCGQFSLINQSMYPIKWNFVG